jgi:hypothetical protein
MGRDPGFIAVHRGGPLGRESHALLARWAADCAQQVLPFFQEVSHDPALEQALEVARAWADGTVKTGVAMKAAVAAHAAARAVKDHPAAYAAARAAGHAVAAAHAADHCMGALLYALKAMNQARQPTAMELESRLAALPKDLRGMVALGVESRLGPLKIQLT